MNNRWDSFTDEEIYILKRQAMESSHEIEMIGLYSEEEKELHARLLNELIEEDRRRTYD